MTHVSDPAKPLPAPRRPFRASLFLARRPFFEVNWRAFHNSFRACDASRQCPGNSSGTMRRSTRASRCLWSPLGTWRLLAAKWVGFSQHSTPCPRGRKSAHFATHKSGPWLHIWGGYTALFALNVNVSRPAIVCNQTVQQLNRFMPKRHLYGLLSFLCCCAVRPSIASAVETTLRCRRRAGKAWVVRCRSLRLFGLGQAGVVCTGC